MSQYTYQPAAPARETNGLGVAGFVCSMVGLFLTGGLLSPVGLILSLVAMGRRPRGFAVAGVIVGAIGSCGLAILLLLAGAGILAALGLAVVAVALTETEKIEITSDMVNMVVSIKAYEEENRYLPAELGLLGLKTSTLTDPWGNAYEYHLIDDDPGFDLVSRGEDGASGTEDDIRLTTLGETWEGAGFNMKVQESDDGGRVTFTIGDSSFVAEGGDEGGRVTIDLGDRVIEIVGDDAGGEIRYDPGADDEGDAADEDTGADVPDAPAPPTSQPDDR